MDNHTFIGKRKVASTDISDFTDFQGIGNDPLYRRYPSVLGVISRVIHPEYQNFFAAPDYNQSDDTISWYIPEWKELPVQLTKLSGSIRQKYERIKDETISHYRTQCVNLSGENLKVLGVALKYINDEFIFCADNKVYLVAWGMTPDTNKHISLGELVHGVPEPVRYTVKFESGLHGGFVRKGECVRNIDAGTVLTQNDLPELICEDGYEMTGWEPDPVGFKVERDTTFVARYRELPKPQPPVENEDTRISEEKEEEPPEDNIKVVFNPGNDGKLSGQHEFVIPRGTGLPEGSIPAITPRKGMVFKGWNLNPLNAIFDEDTEIYAEYEKRKKRLHEQWWFWLLLLLLALLLAWLISHFMPSCDCEGGGVDDKYVDTFVDKSYYDDYKPLPGDKNTDNGRIEYVEIGDDGRLPDENYMPAPVREPDDSPTPIVREPGVPPVVANRLLVLLEDENDNAASFIRDFKKAYPDSKYQCIGYDNMAGTVILGIPASERVSVRNDLPKKITNHRFIVMDEEILELNADMSTPAVPSSGGAGWHLNAIGVDGAWNITRGSPSVVVAVVDDGFDLGHPMFKGRVFKPYNIFTRNSRIGLGQGHGTHTAGLAVGSDANRANGAAGVAPGCRLMPVQVFDHGICPISALVSGIMYSIRQGADVVNVSIGPGLQQLSQLPISDQRKIAAEAFKNTEQLWKRVCNVANRKNVVIVFAAGNDHILSSIPPENRTKVALTVSAVNQQRCQSEFTNFGEDNDISAPGDNIVSSFPKSSFRAESGTSQAAPIIAGTVALMKTLKKDLTLGQIKNVLYRTGADVYGQVPPMVQVDKALVSVKRGDFSAGPRRPYLPLPGQAEVTDPARNGDGKSSSGDYQGGGDYTPDPGYQDGGYNGGGGKVVDPGGSTMPTAPGDDYDAIRRLIREHEKEIERLKSQLPEYQKKSKK